MYSLLRPFLFQMDAEKAHHLTLSALRYAPSCCFASPIQNPVHAMGLSFSHPVGLAAGLDKNGTYLDPLAKMGFSFIELGTVTPKPQYGNPKPRLFRAMKQQAIVNRMGFNNWGVHSLVEHIKKAHYQGILGINIGKNKNTDLNHAVDDYLLCMREVYPYASYITVNISSPNTPDLRQLQQGSYFSSMLAALRAEQMKLQETYQKHVPLVVKISPDESEETLKQMAAVMLTHGVEGIITTNTSAQKDFFAQLPQIMQQGGFSGVPLCQLATNTLKLMKHYVGNDITLIGVGGINDVASAQEKIDAGASLIQLYSGLVYQGPQLISKLAKELVL